MPTYTVTVKWNKETISVPLDTDESPETFKEVLSAYTGVEPSRQTVMMKGQTLKDDWSKFKLKDGVQFLMMGTPGEQAPKAPEKATVFLEDLQEGDIPTDGTKLGLMNVGNTCYMNATLQCLRTVPELVQVVNTFSRRNPRSNQLLTQLAGLYNNLDTAKKVDDIKMSVLTFWMTLQQQNPQFAQMNEGHPAQQDANECWLTIMRNFQDVPSLDAAKNLQPALTNGRSFADQFFGITQTSTLKCLDAPDEAPTTTTEMQHQLRCHIEKDVGFLMAGVKQSMTEEIAKHSASLGRDARYSKVSHLTRLPAYLTVSYVRFYFKRQAQENCKIRKDVKFSLTLDAFELCSPELQERLKPARDDFMHSADYETALLASDTDKGKAKAKEAKEEPTELFPSEFPDDVGSNNSGFYELSAVLTHKGRSSDSGHYVAWVREKGNKWLLFDDDKVTPQTEEDILKLSGTGGADWHTAYILLYSSKKCPVYPKDAAAASAPAAAPAATQMDTAP